MYLHIVSENIFNNRPIRDSRNGRNVIITATAAHCRGPAASGGGHRSAVGVCVLRQNEEIYIGARAGGLPIDWFHQPEGKSLPREILVHCSLSRFVSDNIFVFRY